MPCLRQIICHISNFFLSSSFNKVTHYPEPETTNQKDQLHKKVQKVLQFAIPIQCYPEWQSIVVFLLHWTALSSSAKLSLSGQTFGTKTPKKYYHVDILEALVHWPLAFSMKAGHDMDISLPLRSPSIRVCLGKKSKRKKMNKRYIHSYKYL